MILLAALLLLTGCAAPGARSRLLEPILAPKGFAFLVPGIWPDATRTNLWVPAQARALERRGVAALPVDYTCFLPGYVLGHGTDRPAARIAAFVRALEAEHAATGCAAPLRLSAIGFSAGTMVLLKATEAGAALDRVYYGGSPLSLVSGRLEEAMRAGKMAALVNYCSPFDGVVGGVLGCGCFGFLGEGAGRVENRGHLHHHLDPVFQGEEADRVAREIAAGGRAGPAHTCVEDARFAAWLREAARALAEEGRTIPAAGRGSRFPAVALGARAPGAAREARISMDR